MYLNVSMCHIECLPGTGLCCAYTVKHFRNRIVKCRWLKNEVCHMMMMMKLRKIPKLLIQTEWIIKSTLPRGQHYQIVFKIFNNLKNGAEDIIRINCFF